MAYNQGYYYCIYRGTCVSQIRRQAHEVIQITIECMVAELPKEEAPMPDGKHIVLNFDFTDTKDKYMIEMTNGVLNHTADEQAKKADTTIKLTRVTLNQIILQETTLKQAIDSGKVKITGSQAKLEEMLSYLDSFKFWFNIVTP